MLTILKILFVLLLAIHGLIHLMGFAKAFEFAKMEQLTQPISRFYGVIWLFATTLFFAAIPIYLLKKDWWWIIGLAAVIVSQFVIFTSWQDAKFGTIANVIVLVVLIIGFGQWNFNRTTNKAIAEIGSAAKQNAGIVSFKDCENLPAPVARYFRFALKDGQPIRHHAKIRHAGEFNMGDKWIPFESEQHFSSDPPGFVWDANMEMNPLMNVRVRDGYSHGKGTMQGKILGLLSVVNANGGDPKLASGALQRYLAESAWQPTALLPSKNLKWEPIDENCALATLTDSGVTVSLEFTFNEKGEIVSVFSPARFREINGEYKPFPWAGRFWNYQERDGMMIPIEGEVEWQMPEGNLPYWRGKVTEVVCEP